MGVLEAIAPGPVALDTAIFIYFIEQHPRFGPMVDPIFEAADTGRRQIVTSALTILEVLVAPYRAKNDTLARRYEVLLTDSKGIHVVDIGRDVLRGAARLRALAGVKTPDALQLSTALVTRCSTFVTNDRRLPDIPGLRIVQLDAMST